MQLIALGCPAECIVHTLICVSSINVSFLRFFSKCWCSLNRIGLVDSSYYSTGRSIEVVHIRAVFGLMFTTCTMFITKKQTNYDMIIRFYTNRAAMSPYNVLKGRK